MNKTRFVPFLAGIILLITCFRAEAQLKTNTAILQRAGTETAIKEKAEFQKLLILAKEKNWPLSMKNRTGGRVLLVGVDERGYPRYLTTNDNIISAATIKTNLLWPGGSTGLNLSGSSANMKGKIAIWDGGKVRNTHVELVNRVVQKDNATVIDDHATHTSGTLIASGVNPHAKGMSFGAQQLLAYDYNNDKSEMLTASPNLLVSNHSYGDLAGWNFNATANRWEFYANPGDTVSYLFGYYDSYGQMWDSIAYNAPYYLIVKSAGNNRGETGPDVGQPYYRFNSNRQLVKAGNRPTGISSNDGYDILPTFSVAKNILTVGAINPIPNGYLQPSDVQISDFSSWGPTDDGRIKPDVVTDGVNVLSSYGTADNAYAVLSGTSMASPAAAGSTFLLQEYYSKLHAGVFMRSATLKGIIIHTADEAGTAPGPDYIYGWGLINMQKAASVITSDTMATQPDQKIYENNLVNGGTYTLNITASGKGPLIATICWTDPKGLVDNVNILNNPARKLINDLDLRITNGANTYLPWTLDRIHPANAAVRGDDSINNVEKIVIDNPIPGQTYTIKVTHKGVLQRGAQAYSLLISGIGGQAYCISAPTSNAGARIDSVNFGSIKNANPAGCTTYTDYTNLSAQIYHGQTIPFSIKLSSCDASTASKMVKIYIDYNNNGVFDANEMVAQSGVINGNGTFTGTITTPTNLVASNSTVMRIIAEETSDPTTITPCGTYGKGETEDYNIQVINPLRDIAVTQITNPIGTICATDSQLVTVVLTNFGSNAQINIPIHTTISNGATTVANLDFVYPDSLPGLSSITYTYQSAFSAVAGNTYTIASRTSLAGDTDSTNDQTTATVIVTTGNDTPSGIAELCDSKVFLKSTVADTSNIAFWYNTATAVTPIAVGNSTSSTLITSDHTYYMGLNDKKLSIGPANKLVYPQGGYNTFVNNYVSFTNQVPLTLESARLYIGNAGKINFTVLDTADGFENIISSTTIDVYPTMPTPLTAIQLGANVNNASDTGAIYYLNLPVPETGSHLIVIQCLEGASIFRNNNITPNPYPFSIPGVMSITSNSAVNTADTSDVTFYQKYYYFFYNMKIQLANCPVTNRVPVVATASAAPVISLAGNLFSSTPAISYQWYVNGSAIAGATNQTDTAIASGSYTVVTDDGLECPQTSNAITYAGSGSGIGLKVYPNPNSGQFTLQFQTATTDDLYIILTNTIGQEVYRSNVFPAFTGLFNNQIHVESLAAGMYYLKVLIGKKVYIEKVIVR